MSRVWNKTGPFCFWSGFICDHNMSDAPMIRRDVCANNRTVCDTGSKWEWYEKANDTLHKTPETIEAPPVSNL
jgi:hypothetical protein